MQKILALGMMAAMVFVITTAAERAEAVAFSGTPFCQDLGVNFGFSCGIDVEELIDEVVQDDSIIIEVFIENMQHLEIFDSDLSDENEGFSMNFALTNMGSEDALFSLAVDLLDEGGNIIDPPGTFQLQNGLALGPNVDFTGFGSGLLSFEEFAPIIVHGVRLDIGIQGGPVEFGNFSSFIFTGVDPDSNVGVWAIDEPASMLLFVLGLGGLALMRRERAMGVTHD